MVRKTLPLHGGLLWCSGCSDMHAAPAGNPGERSTLVCRHCGDQIRVRYDAQLEIAFEKVGSEP